MSFGLAGIAVLFNPLFLCGSALSGGLYFGTAGLGHIRSVKTNREEVFSMVTDLIAFLMIEGLHDPVIIGQSMGGYLGQMYSQLFPEKLRGFISIDSAPLQKEYMTRAELWLLKRMEPVYSNYPWKLLLKQGCNGVAVSNYGRLLMLCMMMTYDSDKKRYAELAGHGYRILAEAVEADLPYEIKCPALLICGDKDHAGSCIREVCKQQNTEIDTHKFKVERAIRKEYFE